MPSGAVVLDRVHEKDVLGSLVSSAGEGTSGALVVYGEAGMGKSALLDHAASSTGLAVARISGVETERSFGFAALHRLLRPFLHRLDRVPAPQRSALETAFGLLEAGPPDRFMVSLAALTLLSVESARTGLVCIVDDAQWIDMESLKALGFVARRLGAEGIALIFGVRTILDVPTDLRGIPALEVAGLPTDAATELLRMVAGRPVPEQVAERVATETGGCPLALWELGTALTDQSGPIGLLAEPVPINRRLREHFDAQIAALSFDAQRFLLAAAADVTGDRALVRATAVALGCPAESEAEAERERLILAGPRITFRHPMIRSAVYAGAPPDLRRAVHRTFASVMSKTSYPDSWARHVVLGATGPDARLASELDETSQIAKARGGYGAEAALLVQAAELTEPLELRAARLLRAAAAALNAGDNNQALTQLDEAQPHLSNPFAIAEAAQLRAQLSIQTFQTRAAPGQMLEAARLFLPLNNSRAREVLLEAFKAYAISIHFTSGIEASDIARLANSTTQTGPQATLEDHLLEGTALLVSDDPEIAFPRYRQAAELLREGTISHDQMSRWSLLGSVVAGELLDDRTQQAWVERSDRSARDNGALFALLLNLFALAEGDTRAGDLLRATARYEEALDVAAAIGLPAQFYQPMCAEILAWAGDEEPTRTYAAQLIELNSAAGIAVPVIMGYRALAILHLGAGRYSEAVEATTYVHAQSPFGWTSPALPLAIEAAARSNEPELAESLLRRLDGRATASGTPWALGLAARSRALLSEGVEAERMYRSALEYLSHTLVPRDLAHARLLYGEWLRRENRRLDARDHLRAAHEFFATMGAKGFAQRAEGELLATGEQARPRTVDRAADLTPQERRVATLAAERLTNPEIAAKLFLSPATVDYHLRKVYRKLNISSRRQLEEVLRTQSA